MAGRRQVSLRGMPEWMTGAEALLRTLAAQGVEVCFMNPGTSEMQFVAALDRAPGVRGVLCLDESVAAGAADGYARAAGKPAAALLHLGPGLANALSNLHNARKARSGVVNIVGEHATWHLAYDAPLTADIEAVARPFSDWVAVARTAEETAPRAAEAVAAARAGQVATLIVPADASWDRCTAAIPAAAPAGEEHEQTEAAERAAGDRRRLGGRAGLLLSGRALSEAGLEAAARLHAGTGARDYANRFAARLPRGRGVFPAARIPYFPEPAEAALAGLELLYTVETQAPVTFFGYPGRPSTLAPAGCRTEDLPGAALAPLARLCGAAAEAYEPEPPQTPEDGPLTPDSVGRTLAALLPAGSLPAAAFPRNCPKRTRLAATASRVRGSLTTTGRPVPASRQTAPEVSPTVGKRRFTETSAARASRQKSSSAR